jgi:hypothetical protein
MPRTSGLLGTVRSTVCGTVCGTGRGTVRGAVRGAVCGAVCGAVRGTVRDQLGTLAGHARASGSTPVGQEKWSTLPGSPGSTPSDRVGASLDTMPPS